MSQGSNWKERIALSLRVAATVAVLGFVVLSAEQRLAHNISPLEIVASEAALPIAAPPADQPAPAATPSADYYFPAQFPAPTEEVQEAAPTF